MAGLEEVRAKRIGQKNERNHSLINLFDAWREDPEWRAAVLKDSMKLRREEKGAGWVSGKFLHPHDACFDAAGNIFVAEWVNTGRITKLRKVS